jgi:hypothetical protein
VFTAELNRSCALVVLSRYNVSLWPCHPLPNATFVVRTVYHLQHKISNILRSRFGSILSAQLLCSTITATVLFLSLAHCSAVWYRWYSQFLARRYSRFKVPWQSFCHFGRYDNLCHLYLVLQHVAIRDLIYAKRRNAAGIDFTSHYYSRMLNSAPRHSTIGKTDFLLVVETLHEYPNILCVPTDYTTNTFPRLQTQCVWC